MHSKVRASSQAVWRYLPADTDSAEATLSRAESSPNILEDDASLGKALVAQRTSTRDSY